jgi:cytochrome bd ubiquinol oxidase subunit I
MTSIVDFDRFLFAFTIGSHILIVSLSIGMALMICISEFLFARTKDKYYGALVRRLIRPFVVSFGIGTASGIVMAVELVNLFPRFMTLVSQTGVIAIFYTEIFAFFVETVFLVVYVYYGSTFKGRYTRWALTVPIVVGTLLSAVLIVMVNAWMNTPNGFDIGSYVASGTNYTVTGVDPWAPFLTVSTGYEVFHVLTSVPLTGVMILGGFFAYRYTRSTTAEEKTLFLQGLRIAVAVSFVLVVLAILAGVVEIDDLYRYQPLKYAAIELNAQPGTNLPMTIFGTVSGASVVGGFQIPGLQGWLEHGANLPGLSQYPQSVWPPLIIHETFDVMILGAVVLGLFVLFYAGLWVLKRRPFERPILAYAFLAASALTAVVMELGWATDEIGRQPWIVYNTLTVANAANPNSDLLGPGIVIIILYFALIPFTLWFMDRVFRGKPIAVDLEGPAAGGHDVNY